MAARRQYKKRGCVPLSEHETTKAAVRISSSASFFSRASDDGHPGDRGGAGRAARRSAGEGPSFRDGGRNQDCWRV